MPFDFMKHEVYTLNYDKLFNEIMEQSLTKQFKNEEAIMDYIVKVQSEPEIF